MGNNVNMPIAATGVNYKRVIILSYLISIFSCLHLKSNNPVFQFSSDQFIFTQKSYNGTKWGTKNNIQSKESMENNCYALKFSLYHIISISILT